MLCGLSTSLAEMIVFRAGQGFTGGVFIPTAMTIVLRCLPKSKQPIGLALFGDGRDLRSGDRPDARRLAHRDVVWRWIFYINVLPGVVMIRRSGTGLKSEPMQLDRLLRGDWLGIVCMAIGFGSLITVLEEGQRKEWFGDR